MKARLPVGLAISLAALVLIVIRFILPDVRIDAITIGLLLVAALPWASPFIESFKAPGGWEVKLRNLENKVESVIDASSEAAGDTRESRTVGQIDLDEGQRGVLRALTQATVPLRSVQGISVDARLSLSDADQYLEALESQGFAAKVQGKKGIRWAITPAGRKLLDSN